MTEKKRIDWEAVRRRMAQMEQTLSDVDPIDETTLQRVWERRAEQLAVAPETEDDSESIEVLLVRLGSEPYGLLVRNVIDIRPLERLTRVPHTLPWIAGVAHWRGRILTVVDARHYFGLPERGASREPRRTYLVVMESPAMQIGLQVDDVLSISRLRMYQRQVEDVEDDSAYHFVAGLAQSDEAGYLRVAILDLQHVLADPKLIVHEDAS